MFNEATDLARLRQELAENETYLRTHALYARIVHTAGMSQIKIHDEAISGPVMATVFCRFDGQLVGEGDSLYKTTVADNLPSAVARWVNEYKRAKYQAN